MARTISLEKNLSLYITGLCNFRCSTCIREYGRAGNLDVKLLEKVLPQAMAFGYRHVGLTGGEPCLHPEFEKIIEVIVKNGATFNFVSNGSLLGKYEFLLERYKKNLLAANFSLDGATIETNDRIRQDGSFVTAINSIKYFAAEGIDTVLNVTLVKENQDKLEDMMKLAVETGVKGIVFSAAIANSINKDIILTDEEKRGCFRRLTGLTSKYKVAIYPGNPLMTAKGVDTCVGISLLSSPMINPNGEFVFCCNTIREGAVVGSLRKYSFAELYKKALDMVCYLRKTRIDKVNRGVKEEGFNNCEFCNKYLSTYIR